jgi:rsbT co-antagonist protein RsbR
MHRNQKLYDFLQKHAKQISDEWYDSIEDNDPTSVYASSDPVVVSTLREQNLDFNLHLNQLFAEKESAFWGPFRDWIVMIAKDAAHLRTPVHYVIREFGRIRKLYLHYIKEFIQLHNGEIKQKDIDLWNDLINKAFEISIQVFAEEAHKNTQKKLKIQQEIINELSSPVIMLANHMALLPLVGDIDTTRAKIILENTLRQCASKGIAHLYIDLSGVVMIDTMVAQQISHLIKALNLIGVKCTLSGMRPEIAQTAVSFEISFEGTPIKANLAQALALEVGRSGLNNHL